MKLRVVWIGKTKERNLASLVADYRGRIERFLPLDIVEIKDPKRPQDEGSKIMAVLGSSDRVVALDPVGKSWTSEQLASFMSTHMRGDPRPLTFVIGGFDGLSPEVKRRADLSWSLSPLTFTHDLCRVLLLEQLYRALAIIHHHPYSK